MSTSPRPPGYAASAGIDWVVLTNGITWRIYQVLFGKPVETVLVCEFNFCELNVNRPEDYAPLYALSVEAFQEEGNAALSQLYAQRPGPQPLHSGSGPLE